MKSRISIITLLLCIIVTAVAVFMSTYTVLTDNYREELAKAYAEETVVGEEIPELPQQEQAQKSIYEEKLSTVLGYFEGRAYYDLDTEAVIEGMLDGVAYGTGDRYAEYYTAEEYATFTAESNGEMQGIGVNIIFNADYNAIEIINVMPDSPALEAGLLPGDLILYVGLGENAESVAEIGYTMAVSKLQGLAGTKCEFTAVRNENFEEPIDFSIDRRKVTVQTVTHHLYEGDKSIGIIEISQFDKVTPEQFFVALDDLQGKGATKIIFDVRNNPGGDLNAICEILDFLVPEGPIIRMKDKAGNESVIQSEGSEYGAPMAVLCNGSSASAAELFTSALKDYKKAVIVGTTTFGKGSVQTIYSLPDGSGIKMTTKMYFPPFSEGYDGVGITPDIEVEMAEEFKNVSLYKISDADDTQLQKAIEYLNENY
ncbi:MAG: S41 family peptidase [Clostridia bacterium]|nr:S41 family peptidase [Clostridia bacterium]